MKKCIDLGNDYKKIKWKIFKNYADISLKSKEKCRPYNKTSLNFKLVWKKQWNACWNKVNKLSRASVCDYNWWLKLDLLFHF